MRDRVSRRGLIVAAGTVALAGCTGGTGGRPATGPSSGSNGGGATVEPKPSDASGAGAPSTTAASGSGGSTPPTADWSLPLPMAPSDLRGEARSGGPPKDGIPSIDDPKFVSADGADGFLDPGDVVFGVHRNGAAKAYPQSILVWHEICNDEIGGEPVSVAYCPLTGTAMGFERGETTFGVSGRLINNNLVMYDRATEAWWPQVLATAIPGPWNSDIEAKSLREFRAIWTTWGKWKAQYPDTSVLSTDTGHARNYNQDPYGSYNPKGGYYSRKNTLFSVLNRDDRYHPKKVVMGARTPEGAVAFVKDALREKRLVEGELAGTPVLAAYDPRLDTAHVYRNPDGETFAVDGGQVVAGDGTAYAPGELPLSAIVTFDAMWFAWSGFYPETGVYE